MFSLQHFRRIVGTVMVANTLSWYEFSLYVLFSSELAAFFFPNDMQADSLMGIFFIFFVGFISRPLGTLFFSHIGDKIGRRTALLISILFATIPTFGIGLIPSYAAIGIAAPILLAAMRIIQGFATGGEFAGTMCYLYEVSPQKHRGFTGSLVFSTVQLGNVLSTVEFLAINHFFPSETFGPGRWRISFILGGLTGLVSWSLRRTLHETPLFEMIRTEGKLSKRPILDSLASQKIPMVKAFGLSSLAVAGWYLTFVFFPIYLSNVLKIESPQRLLIHSLLLLGSSLLMPLFGYLSDLHYRRPLFFISAIAVFFLAIPLYASAASFSFVALITLQIIALFFLTAQFAMLPVLLCELFPVRLRYTCVGIGYNFCNFLFGGGSPFIALTLTERDHHLLAPAFILILSAILSVCTYKTVKQEKVHI